ncbi:alpha/beta hydrolase family protein [Paenibacillus puerhi]|uniref:alpha/beta hydrolase family protein n=1 Tax=Paenibacillus puerhi TaxID=2692622 RepID=UPI00135BA873|nr:alpha/beta fold hydrolase [Paenibacillus puerhi]
MKKTIVVEHETITDRHIPTLFCYPPGVRNAPLVFFMHGFTGSKMGDVGYGIRLAEEGFFAVLIDARMHGERKPDRFDEIFQPGDNFKKSCFEMVCGNVEDIRTIMDALQEDPRIDPERIGITGISMGGFTSFMLACEDKRVKALAPLIASPAWDVLASSEELQNDRAFNERVALKDALLNYQKLKPAALLVQNGVKDDIIPITGTRRLHEKMVELYADMEERYAYIEYEDAEHKITEEMFERVIRWFHTFL